MLGNPLVSSAKIFASCQFFDSLLYITPKKFRRFAPALYKCQKILKKIKFRQNLRKKVQYFLKFSEKSQILLKSDGKADFFSKLSGKNEILSKFAEKSRVFFLKFWKKQIFVKIC